MTGPKVRIERSCLKCECCRSEAYRCQGDSGRTVSCVHPSLGQPRFISDTNWNTPDWCPVLRRTVGLQEEEVTEGALERAVSGLEDALAELAAERELRRRLREWVDECAAEADHDGNHRPRWIEAFYAKLDDLERELLGEEDIDELQQ